MSPRARAVEVVDASAGDVEVAATAEAVTAVEVPAETAPPAVEVDGADTTVEAAAASGVTTVEASDTKVVELEVSKPAAVALPVPSDPDVIEVIAPGPQGIQGDQGVKGDRGDPGPAGAGASYVHYQSIPAAVWNIQHLLGFQPGGIEVQDSAGTNVEGDVVYVDADNIQITFSASFGGVAYLS